MKLAAFRQSISRPACASIGLGERRNTRKTIVTQQMIEENETVDRCAPSTALERALAPTRAQKAIHVAITSVLLLALWLVLSGHYEPFYIAFGTLSVAIVAYLSRGLLGTVVFRRDGSRRESLLTLEPWHSMAWYLPWLLLAIVKANIQVASIVLDPRMPINPLIIRFDAPLPSDVAQVTLAQSITLTPGTVTVDLVGSSYTVHALTPESAEDLLNGAMQAKVEKAFTRPEWKRPHDEVRPSSDLGTEDSEEK